MELKPCPRCQSESNLHDYHGEIAPICWKCRLSGPYFQTSDEAIEWWNTRSTDPLMKEMAEALSMATDHAYDEDLDMGDNGQVCTSIVFPALRVFIKASDQLIHRAADATTTLMLLRLMMRRMVDMPSREEIAQWLRDGANEISNTYRHMPKKTREDIGVQQIIDKMRNRATQVENMSCENCRHADFTTAIDRCKMWGCFINFSCGCFSWESKEVTNATKP